MKPIVIVNFKNYQQGKKLAKKIEGVDKNIIVGVQASDIREISKATKLRVYSQYVNFLKSGKHILPETVKNDGAKGTFLNHSEHPLKFSVLKKTIKRCKKLGLKIAVFAKNLTEAKKIKKLKPDYLIIEPPELIGGKVSVSKAKPELIEKIAKELKTKFLVGAGIRTREDVKIAMKLGASGIAISSAITKAKNPGRKLKELLKNS